MHNLVVNIDDFGMSPEISARIIRVLDQELASSVSVFVNAEFKDSLTKLKKYSGKIDTGIHLAFDLRKPNFSPTQVLSSFRKQVETATEQDFNISHLDNHRPEVYFYPEIFKGVIALASELGVYLRYPLVGLNPETRLRLSKSYGVEESKIQSLHEVYKKEIKLMKTKILPNFIDLKSFQATENIAQQFSKLNEKKKLKSFLTLETQRKNLNIIFIF